MSSLPCPGQGDPPPCLPMGTGQSWPKSCYPKCLVTGSLAAAALGKVGSQIRKAPRLLTRLLASPPAPSPATRTSSVCAYTPSRSPCLLRLPCQCSPSLLISRCQQSHCYHGSEPPQLLASTRRPSYRHVQRNRRDSPLSDLQDFLLNIFIV